MKFIVFLILALFAIGVLSCGGTCSSCSCVGVCSSTTYCLGVGSACYCGESNINNMNIIEKEQYAASILIKSICDHVSNRTTPFVFPISGIEQMGLLIKCNNNIFESSIFHD